MAQGAIRPYESKINAIARLIDSTIIVLTFLAASDAFSIEWQSSHLWLLFASVVFFNFFAESTDTYRSWRGVKLAEELSLVSLSWLAAAIALILLDIFYINVQVIETLGMLVWIVLTPLEIVSWHMIVRSVLSWFRKKGHNTRHVAIIGNRSLSRQLENALNTMEWAGYEFKGYFDDRSDERLAEEVNGKLIKNIGTIDDAIEQCRKGLVDTIFITLPMSAEHRIKMISEKLADTTASVYLVPDLFTFNLLNARWVDYQGITAIAIYETPYAGLDSFIKRLEDIVLSLVFITITLIPMIFIACGVKLTSKGPILFKQTRYGMNGEKIKVWKFRSMTVAEDGDTVVQAKKGDSRITPLGAFLRRTSLDELPQFFNSLSGSMSIVGPRPHAVAHNELYRSKIHGYMLRHKVKPGITGLAQINGFRGETETLDKMEGRVRFDLTYIQTWSVLLDLKIILLTVFKGFRSKNAY